MSLYTLTNVEQRYGARTVLRIPQLTVETGSLVALVGPSGAGKSTLLRLLALLEQPSCGDLRLQLDDKQLNAQTATLAERRRVVLTFQRPVLLSTSVRENIAYGLRLRGQATGRVVDHMIERLGLRQVANARPTTLSGGELQRVALARALIVQPDVVLLDEPTANLDPENVRLIEHILQEEHQQRRMSIVIVTHNLFQARRLATHIGVLLDNTLIEYGDAQLMVSAPHDPRVRAFLQGELIF